MDREVILQAIRTEALLNGGKALGKDRFFQKTGIKDADWLGKYWVRWSDVVREAGVTPNEFQGAHDKSTKLRNFLELTRRLGHPPTVPEMRLEKRSNPSFPNEKSLISDSGGRTSFLQSARAFCISSPEFSDCLALLETHDKRFEPSERLAPQAARRGYVYLIKSGRHFKIGITEALYRRAAQIANGTPQGAELLHSFATDDPRGIETYWHQRFASKRVQGANIASGEWFLLDSFDIAAFKLRKTFM
jgi:hypothetical protein